MGKCALLLGGTGAMGVYLSEELSSMGYSVTVTTRKACLAAGSEINYLVGNAKEQSFLEGVVRGRSYDLIVDFMVWTTEEFRAVAEVLLSSCRRYFYLSSYRVFADSEVLTEESPRLLDVSEDADFLSTDEYALAKARQEDILAESPRGNYTIVRPSITYSKARFQLCTLEANNWLWRVTRGKSVPLVPEMLERRTTMTWAGDVARFIARLASNPDAEGEAYNVVSSESLLWGDVVDVYRQILGRDGYRLNVAVVSLEQYLTFAHRYQTIYDRMFDRVLDNTKVLNATGMSQHELAPLRERLALELDSFLQKPAFRRISPGQQGRMDKVVGEFSPACFSSVGDKIRYCIRRLFV